MKILVVAVISTVWLFGCGGDDEEAVPASSTVAVTAATTFTPLSTTSLPATTTTEIPVAPICGDAAEPVWIAESGVWMCPAATRLPPTTTTTTTTTTAPTTTSAPTTTTLPPTTTTTTTTTTSPTTTTITPTTTSAPTTTTLPPRTTETCEVEGKQIAEDSLLDDTNWLDAYHRDDSFSEDPLSYFWIDSIFPLEPDGLRPNEVVCWVDAYLWTDIEDLEFQEGSDEYYESLIRVGALCFDEDGWSWQLEDSQRPLSRSQLAEDCLITIRAPLSEERDDAEPRTSDQVQT